MCVLLSLHLLQPSTIYFPLISRNNNLSACSVSHRNDYNWRDPWHWTHLFFMFWFIGNSVSYAKDAGFSSCQHVGNKWSVISGGSDSRAVTHTAFTKHIQIPICENWKRKIKCIHDWFCSVLLQSAFCFFELITSYATKSSGWTKSR